MDGKKVNYCTAGNCHSFQWAGLALNLFNLSPSALKKLYITINFLGCYEIEA